MHFDKRDLYKAEIEPLINKIFEICEKHQIPFTHSTTVMANEEGTTVTRGALGTMNPETTDPYTRVGLALCNLSPEEVEMIWLAIVTFDIANQRSDDVEKQMVARFN